jgi:hypothetical protein
MGRSGRGQFFSRMQLGPPGKRLYSVKESSDKRF